MARSKQPSGSKRRGTSERLARPKTPPPGQGRRRRARATADGGDPSESDGTDRVGKLGGFGRHRAGDPVGSDGGDGSRPRSVALDALRGFAIVLMIVDHVADLWLDHSIRDSWTRTATRLAMPLFCVLMGYFLRRPPPNEKASTRTNEQTEERAWFASIRTSNRRLFEIVLASFLANLLFYPHYGVLEILAGLSVAWIAHRFVGPFFVVLVAAIALYPLDPLTRVFDFPITLVLAFVAQGTVLRRFGIAAALITGLGFAAAAFWIWQLQPRGVNHLLAAFALPATGLVAGMARVRDAPTWMRPLAVVGRYPLSIYVGQYYVITVLGEIIRSGR